MTIQIKYHVPDLLPAEHISVGNWIDLRAAETIELAVGDYKLISLGVSMKLPDGYEGWVVPRSSTYKTWGLIQANGIGVIDAGYSGTGDIWYFPAIATRDTIVKLNDRICQFRIVPVMETVTFIEADALDPVNRNGFGSTGQN